VGQVEIVAGCSPDNIITKGQTLQTEYMMPVLHIAHSVLYSNTDSAPPADVNSYYEACAAQLERFIGFDVPFYLSLNIIDKCPPSHTNCKDLMPKKYTDEEMKYILELWISVRFTLKRIKRCWQRN
jgi:hypothetical protein